MRMPHTGFPQKRQKDQLELRSDWPVDKQMMLRRRNAILVQLKRRVILECRVIQNIRVISAIFFLEQPVKTVPPLMFWTCCIGDISIDVRARVRGRVMGAKALGGERRTDEVTKLLNDLVQVVVVVDCPKMVEPVVECVGFLPMKTLSRWSQSMIS